MLMRVACCLLVAVLVSGNITSSGISVLPAYAQDEEIFPIWVKTIFKFWASGDVSDAELKSALEFLIKAKVIDVSSESGDTGVSSGVSSSGNVVEIPSIGGMKIGDSGFFAKATKSITDVVKKVKDNPALDLLATTLLPEIPVVGGLLGKLYENAPGTTEDKNSKILQVLERLEKMDEAGLKQTFEKIGANKAAILNNTYLLDNLLADTKQILAYTSDTNMRVKSMEAKLDKIMVQLSDIKLGKGTVKVPEELKAQMNEITQLNLQVSDVSDLDTGHLGALAKTHLLQDDYDSAVTVYDRILENDSANRIALEEKAWALLEGQKLDEAQDAFDALLESYPDDADVLVSYGWFQFDMENLEESREYFMMALDLDTSDVVALEGIGRTYLEDDCELAMSYFNQGLDVEPDNQDILDAVNEISEFGC